MSKKFNLTMIVLVFILSATNVFTAVKSDDNVWKQVNDANLQKRSLKRVTVPTRYTTFRLNKTNLESILLFAPEEAYSIGEKSEIVLSIPLPNGEFQKFAIKESPIMEAELAAKFPQLKTYLGQGIDNPTATVRFDTTQHGFHAMILSDEGTVYVDPYAVGDTQNYISYYKSNANKDGDPFVCHFDENNKPMNFDNNVGQKYLDTPNIVTNGGTLRSYRLALAATGEYTNAVPGTGTVADGMAAMTTSMNRVNGIYERELSIRMNLVANNNLVVYTNGATDPYTNTNGSTMLGQNTTNLNAVIGSANYDIGHVFSTGGGGVATLNSPCSSNKARGVTGLPNPTGDAFDVDYVAHEMGHQWGGNHTFNGSTGSCAGGNRSASNAFEPGSGTTIQAYAGICSPQNLQRNSNDYFHVRSLEEMVTFSNNAATGGSCSVNTASGNTVPTVSISGGTTFNIPRNTPFALTAIGGDVDGDTLTYNWEEYSLGPQAAPSSTANAPMMRSYSPTTSPTRTFPSLTYILNNDNVPPATYTTTSATGAICNLATACITGEFLSSITRTMPFQVTVRDNRTGGGAVRSAQASVVVDVNSGPFKVTAQDSLLAPNWNAGTTQTVTWNVANTTASPVSAANVDITLSTDGGQTFPHTLATSTPNDGSQSVMIPLIPATTQARIKVQGSGNIFFDISNVNFTILHPTAAAVSVSGRVINSNGNGIGSAFLTLINSETGEQFNAVTNQFGHFKFENLQVGNFYVLTVSNRKYSFPNNTQSFTLNDELTDLTFIGN